MHATATKNRHATLIALLDRHWAVTPTHGKKPFRPGWQSEDPLSRDQLLVHDGNYALRTGQVSGGIYVIDDDGDGLKDLDLPETVEVATGRGRHLYFYSAKPLKNKVKINGRELDIRGDGGCAIIPPSIHPDTNQPYEWTRSPLEFEIAPLPQCIRALLEVEEKPRAPRRTEFNRGSYGNGALLLELAAVRSAQNGQRNHTLNTAAFSLGQLVGGGEIDRGTVEDELLAAALEVGLPETEARGTIRSGITAGIAQPRNAPEGYRQTPRPAVEEDKTIANFSFVEVNGETWREAIPLPEILSRVHHLTHHWPRSVSGVLFKVDGTRIRYIEKPEHLFAFLAERYPVRWSAGSGYDGQTLTPKNEFFASVVHNARAYDTIEVLPHEPALPRAYYAFIGDSDYKPTGEYLNKVCAFFNNAETPIDRALIRAMFLTPAWGGLPGMRPGFAVVAPDRGCGKTALTGAVAQVYGGIEIEPDGGNEERIMSRLLSPNALTQRTVRIDNIKRCVSSGTLESLITCHTISGHRLYHGDASRPNYLTWLLTGNTIRLSRDISERCFIIRLSRPTPRPRWNEDLYEFIEEHRARIVADAIEELKAPPCQHTARDRWQSWVDNVLARVLDLPESVTEENQKRRGDFDEDVEEAALIASALRAKGEGFISAADAAAALETVLRVKFTTKRSTQIITGHIEAQRLPGISPVRKRTERGFSVTHVTDCDTLKSECVTLEGSEYE